MLLYSISISAPNLLLSFTDPARQDLALQGSWEEPVPGCLCKAGAPEPGCSCAWQCSLQVEALLQRGCFGQLAFCLLGILLVFLGLQQYPLRKTAFHHHKLLLSEFRQVSGFLGLGQPALVPAERSAPPQPSSSRALGSRRSRPSWPQPASTSHGPLELLPQLLPSRGRSSGHHLGPLFPRPHGHPWLAVREWKSSLLQGILGNLECVVGGGQSLLWWGCRAPCTPSPSVSVSQSMMEQPQCCLTQPLSDQDPQVPPGSKVLGSLITGRAGCLLALPSSLGLTLLQPWVGSYDCFSMPLLPFSFSPFLLLSSPIT